MISRECSTPGIRRATTILLGGTFIGYINNKCKPTIEGEVGNGEPGPAGPKGKKGEKGDVGPSGLRGRQG